MLRTLLMKNHSNCVSDNDHVYEDIATHTIESLVHSINTNDKKRKSVEKINKKAEKKKVDLKPKKTPPK